MSSETAAADLSLHLATARAVFDELIALKARLADVRTAEDARLAYEAALDGETRALAALRRERDALALEQRKRRPTPRPETAPPPPPANRRPTGAPQPETALPERPVRPQTADRRRLKKLVSRWQFVWSLDAKVIAQVNSIADDAERPLGEALALLDWRWYETPLPTESTDEHAGRLSEWSGVLASYADHVRSEIDTVETRYRSVLAIWDRWRNARASDAGLADWNLFIDKSRRQKERDIAATRQEIAAMRAVVDT
jgi:hypothetical protein